MHLPAEYDVVLLCTHDTVQASTFCTHLHLYKPVHFVLIITSMTQYLICSKGLNHLFKTINTCMYLNLNILKPACFLLKAMTLIRFNVNCQYINM